MNDVIKIKCPSCHRFITIIDGKFEKHRVGKGKKKPYCVMGGRRALRYQ